MCIHDWGHYTIERPLTILWAASRLHPEVFPPADLPVRVKDFYSRFFGMSFSDEQIADILAGRL